MSDERIYVVPAERLTAEQIADWSRIQRANPLLDSGFFRPELAQLVGAARGDVEVGIWERAGRPVAFFPFQRDARQMVQPVSGRLSEFHGVIAEPGTPWNAAEFLRGCGLRGWYFDHLVAGQTEFAPFGWSEQLSPYLDLSGGFETYLAERKRQSGSTLTTVLRKARKLEREAGPLRFDFHTTDERAFAALRRWKSEQYRRTAVLDIFRYDWVTKMLTGLQAVQSPDFAGVFSALWLGDEPIAVHLGFRTRTALHIWFPAFDRRFDDYSPGLILLLRLAESAAADGVRRIDLGKGTERYKASFKSGDIRILEGGLDFRVWPLLVRRSWHGTKRWLRTSRHPVLTWPLGATRRVRQWMAFR